MKMMINEAKQNSFFFSFLETEWRRISVSHDGHLGMRSRFKSPNVWLAICLENNVRSLVPNLIAARR